MEELLFYLAFWIAFALIAWKARKKKQLKLSHRQVLQYLDSIDDLYDTAQQYRIIENIIIDLTSTNKTHMKGVKLDVPQLFNGAGRSYNFICDGGVTTKQFLQIAEREREKLLQELYVKTKELERRHVTAATLRRYGDNQSEAEET